MKMPIILSILILLASTCFGQNETRLALVIGNAAYQHGGVLKNPVNDANLMATTLTDLGFDVIKETNAGLKNMQMAFKQFAGRMSNYEVVLFFYAGHGMQIDGQNYLIPVDAQLEDKLSIEFEAFKVSSVNRYFATNSDKLNIMILDACRNNPYRAWSRGGERGFKAIGDQGAGTIIAFATREGETASDGTGGNGLFTQHLVAQMKVRQNITDVFQNTRVTVLKASNKQQVPQEWNMLTGNFYFVGKAIGNAEVKLGNIESTLTYGNISLASELEGDLYLDGKNIGTVSANTKVPINKISTGYHTLKIGEWSQSFVVEENKVSEVSFTLEESWFLEGIKLQDNYKRAEAFGWFLKAAKAGYPTAQSCVGVYYLFGNTPAYKDEVEANSWFEKSLTGIKSLAEKNNIQAQHQLGLMYLNGSGVEKDGKLMVSWFRKAADQGDTKSQSFLGSIYKYGFGEGVEKDDKQAVFWFQKAANQGDAQGQYSLGTMYESGQGVEKNYEKALLWYQKSADQGDAQGQFYLSSMYSKGLGVEKNYEEALKWIERSIKSRRTIGAIVAKSVLFGQMGKFEDSEKILDEASETSSIGELNQLGYEMLRQGKNAKAIEYFLLNVKNNPNDANVHDSLGEAYKINGDNKLAIKAFKKSLSLNPPPSVKANSIKLLKELGVKGY